MQIPGGDEISPRAHRQKDAGTGPLAASEAEENPPPQASAWREKMLQLPAATPAIGESPGLPTWKKITREVKNM